jgi:hypothetical protein
MRAVAVVSKKFSESLLRWINMSDHCAPYVVVTWQIAAEGLVPPNREGGEVRLMSDLPPEADIRQYSD